MERKKLLVVFTSYYFGDKADKVLTELEVPHQLMATPPRALRYVRFIYCNRLKYSGSSKDHFKRT